ncbi:MAG: aldo/keto reductase [Alphaproteobacteria bacterium]|jgi:2,5-diketo-D-gluconate reductase B
MKYITHHGTTVPALGFGTYRLVGETVEDPLRWALETGYRHIDTAQRYENEANVGKVLEESGIARDDIFLTTKLGMTNLAADKVKSSFAESLEKLRTDHVDLLLIHWPVRDVPQEETLAAMQEIEAAGGARHIGISNFTIPMIEAAARQGVKLFTNQIEYHPLLRQKRLMAAIFANDMVLTGHSPIATGRVADNDLLAGIGARCGKSPAQVAIRWQLEQDKVMVLPKSQRREIIAENFNVFDFALDADDMAAIGTLPHNERGVKPPQQPDWDPND